jgi:hypothetical protein
MCLSSNQQGNDHFGPPLCCGVGLYSIPANPISSIARVGGLQSAHGQN